MQGDTTFTVPVSSTGGHSISASFTVNIGPDSTISYSPPSGLAIGRNFTLEIDVTDYATEANPSSYAISCGDASGVDSTRLVGVTHTGSSCTFTVDPIDTLASGLQGATTFSVPVSSTGGHSLNAAFTVNIGPDSAITVSPPSSIAIAASRSRTVNFSNYATDSGGYTISCATPTTSSSLITIGTPTGCSVAITSGSSMGTATVSVVFTSAGGETEVNLVLSTPVASPHDTV